MTSWITVCDSCKREGWAESGATRSDGEVLAELVEAAALAHPAVRTRRMTCTMGCERACNVLVQGAGKLNYTLGRFDPVPEAAEAIAAWAALHAESATGQVPYRSWPQAVKGHFVTRHPPLPETDEPASGTPA